MTCEVQSYSAHKALRFMEQAGFTHIEEMRDIPSGPLFYVLPDTIRKLHPRARLFMCPNIAHIREVQTATHSNDMVKLTFRGLFGYWGLEEGTEKRIYLGGGRVDDTGPGRERGVVLHNCFTTTNPSLEAYFPLDEQAELVRTCTRIVK